MKVVGLYIQLVKKMHSLNVFVMFAFGFEYIINHVHVHMGLCRNKYGHEPTHSIL